MRLEQKPREVEQRKNQDRPKVSGSVPACRVFVQTKAKVGHAKRERAWHKLRVRPASFTCFIALVTSASSCSNDCVPVSGGIVVDVTGAPACERVTVSANDGTNAYQLDPSGTIESDAGTVCVFQGLSAHPGTFTIQAFIDNAPAGSQAVTLEKFDDCNVTSKLVSIDVAGG